LTAHTLFGVGDAERSVSQHVNVRTPQRHGQSVVNLASQVIVEKIFLSMKAIATF